MVRVLSIISFALATLSVVSGLVVPRTEPPNGWDTDLLEPYDQYHARYLALQCQDKHSQQQFFKQCCHPLLATENLDSRPPQCTPKPENCDEGNKPPPSTTSTMSPTPTHVPSTSPASPQPKPAPSSSTSSTPTPTPVTHAAVAVNDHIDVHTGGVATFFYQNDNAGACGHVSNDNDLICAIDADLYGNTSVVSPLCGRQVEITNVANGHTVTVTIKDACPTCQDSNSIDLSVGAFEELGQLSQGVLHIKWHFV